MTATTKTKDADTAHDPWGSRNGTTDRTEHAKMATTPSELIF